MVPYGVLFRNIKVMRFCLLSLNLCHDSSSYVASDEVQQVKPLTICPARFCIVSICFRFSRDVLKKQLSAYPRKQQTIKNNIVSSDSLLSLGTHCLKYPSFYLLSYIYNRCGRLADIRLNNDRYMFIYII